MRPLACLVIGAAALLLRPTRLPAAELPAAEAGDHIGERTTVCGMVATARYAEAIVGRPTFLDFEKPYPNGVFVAVIWGDNRAAFDTPEKTLVGKRVCVIGVVRRYRGRPEIVLTSPDQLSRP
jgi:DNA/RNA endonuclease YhcR with UshA esterase domain